MSEQKRRMVSREDFITAWETSTSKEEVAKKLGMKETSVSTRASQLRTKYHLPLKQFARKSGGGGGGRKITLEETVAMLARVRGVPVETIMEEMDSCKSE